MNYHNDEWIYNRLREHEQDVLTFFPKERVIGIFYYGSANYHLDTENSDVDTICLLSPPLSTITRRSTADPKTITRSNQELCFCFDIRDWFEYLRGSEKLIKYWEPLFTPYSIVNEKYEEAWNRVIAARYELISYSEYNFYASVRDEAEKLHREIIDFPRASRMHQLVKTGYDCKYLSYLAQYKIFLENHLAGRLFESNWDEKYVEELLPLKLGKLSKNEARVKNKELYQSIISAIPKVEQVNDEEIANLMDNLTKEIILQGVF